MAAVSHACKCVFIHIPKCGGTTIEQHLSRCASAFHHSAPRFSHIPPFDAAEMVHASQPNSNWRNVVRFPRTAAIVNMHPEYFRFTFVRNPYDRFVSYYLHGMRSQGKRGLLFYRNLCECAEFTAEIMGREAVGETAPHKLGIASKETFFLHWTKDHCRRQKDFLLEHHPETYLGVKRTDRKPLSFIGRLENFDEDFMHVQKILRLPRISLSRENISKKRGHYSEYYDAAARRRVEELYAEDLEILGYEYEEKGAVRSLPPLYDLKRAEKCKPEFSRRERRILFLRAIYLKTLWALRAAPLAPLRRLLPHRLRRRLALLN